jgi:hypothetical protein
MCPETKVVLPTTAVTPVPAVVKAAVTVGKGFPLPTSNTAAPAAPENKAAAKTNLKNTLAEENSKSILSVIFITPRFSFKKANLVFFCPVNVYSIVSINLFILSASSTE